MSVSDDMDPTHAGCSLQVFRPLDLLVQDATKAQTPTKGENAEEPSAMPKNPEEEDKEEKVKDQSNEERENESKDDPEQVTS